MRTSSTFITSIILAGAALACGGGEDGPAGGDDWLAETKTANGVTHVRTITGSVWGGSAELVESISIGVDQGEAPYMLGQIAGVAATPERIYVLDASVPVLRVYDRAGTHVQDIGNDGDGPGEFRRPDAMVLAPDGRIFVRDMRQGRITVFGPDGGLVETRPLDQGFVMIGPGSALVMTHDGKVYSPGRVGPRPENMERGGMMRMPMGMVPRGVDGVDGEPIPQPEFDYDPPRFVQERRAGGNVMVRMQSVPFAASIVWAMAPSGAMVGGVATDYGFEIRYPDGTVTQVSKAWDPVPVAPGEGAWNKEQVTANMRQGDPEWVWDADDIAAVKPAYDQFFPDHSGRLWIGRPGPGIENPACEKDVDTGIWDPPCWTDSRVYDVFDLEGRYLGAVEAPEGFRLSTNSFIKDDEIVTPVEDEYGVYTVRGYQIVLPG